MSNLNGVITLRHLILIMVHQEHAWNCPNCDFVLKTSDNYCPECGQKTHLHNETFSGLIMHFIGDYFHYDSKFLITVKALWFSPGKLTIAYWRKQRAKYISPISLYIFISAVFFLVSSLVPNHYIIINQNSNKSDTIAHQEKNVHHYVWGKGDFPSFGTSVNSQEKAENKNDKTPEEIKEQVMHLIPKIFFFLIPFMAITLKLLFIRRKELYYVHHIIYALHYHAFWFSAMFLSVIYPFEAGQQILTSVAFLGAAAYFIISLKKVYNITWARSIVYSAITGLFYLALFLVSITSLLSIMIK